MKIKDIVGSTTKFLGTLKLRRDPKLASLDYGILRVSMMVAALDGHVDASEVATFGTLAKKCRGYSAKSAKEAMTAAMRSAGYIMLLAQTESREKLLAAFAEEALLVMPTGFLNGTFQDVRRAFVQWVAMAMGDGEYSDAEREAIEFLRKTWCEMKRALIDAQTERWLATSPAFQMAYGSDRPRNSKIKLLADDFLPRVEAALGKFDENALADLIENG